MAVPLVINGQSFEYPETGDEEWGPAASGWAQAVTVGMLQKAGGLFQLLSDVDYGTSYGIQSLYYKSRTANIASVGTLRLARTDSIAFRNEANDDDLILEVDSSNNLLFNGQVFNQFVSSIDDTSTIDLTVNAGLLTADLSSATVSSIAAKLPLAGGTMTGNLILNADPSTNLGAATKQYVDSVAQGLDAKQSVKAATTVNGTFASAFANGQSIDGVTLATNDRILIKNQSSQTENGIYIVNASGAPTRSTDADTWAKLVSAFTFVEQGSTQADTGWVSTIDAGGTLGSNNVTFVQFSSAGIILAGSGLTKTTNTLSVNVDNSTIEINSGNLRVKGATGVEIGYLSGVTSSIQTQLGTKITNPMTTGGDLIYGAASGVPTRLANGSSGQVLTSQGGTSAPIWAAQGTPGVQTISGNYTILAGDANSVLFIDTTSARNITLPSPSAGFQITLKDKSGQAQSNNITLIRAGSEQIEGVAASKILQTNWGSWKFISDGTNWFMI